MNTRVEAREVGQKAAQSRTGALVEVGVAYALLEATLWSKGSTQLAWAASMLAWVVFCTLRSGRSAAELGIGKRGLVRSLRIIPAAVLICGGMLAGAWVTGSLHGIVGARTPLWHALLYAAWALVQEFLTMSFIFVRIEGVAGRNAAVIATAGLFCLAHIPNAVLMAATLLMGLLFCWLFQRFRNIYPLAVAHALMGLTLSVSLSSAVTHSMKVGIAYWG